MYIKTDVSTCDEIKKVFDSQPDHPKNVRIFIAGTACSGPSFGLGLDEVGVNDHQEVIEGINFLLEKEVFEENGEISVEWVGNGYSVRPVNQAASGCGSCAGSCG